MGKCQGLGESGVRKMKITVHGQQFLKKKKLKKEMKSTQQIFFEKLLYAICSIYNEKEHDPTFNGF